MKCVNCPYIQEQLKNRITMTLKYDDFIPDFEAAEYEEIDYCYCEKLGHPLYAGRCSDAEVMDESDWEQWLVKNGFDLDKVENNVKYDVQITNDPINEPITETKKQKKRRRDRKHFNKQKRLYKALERWYPTPIWPRYEHDEWWRDENERGDILYFRGYHHNRFKQWLKKQSNKKIRRTKGLARKGNVWKKVFDLWWELW